MRGRVGAKEDLGWGRRSVGASEATAKHPRALRKVVSRPHPQLSSGAGSKAKRRRYHRKLGVLVLDTVGLVDNEIAPVELLEVALLAAQHLEARHNHIKLALLDTQPFV